MDAASHTDADLWIPTGGKKTLIMCHYCRRNISMSCRFRCADPVCNQHLSAGGDSKTAEASTKDSFAPVETCIDCFCAGAALLPHRADHAYRVIDCLEFPLFTKDWTASEELLLLEAIDRHGVGNWKIIAEYIGSKTLKQCEDRYWDVYVGTYGKCLPSTTLLGDKTVETDSLLQPDERDSVEQGFTLIPPNEEKGGVLCREKNKDATRGGKKELDLREKIAQLPGADLAGFMPLRQDFEFEHENSAELILADMEFSDSDHPSETALKLDVVKIYNQKLDERDRRKKFVIETGLVDVKKTQQADRRRSKEDREMASRCRMLARFQSPSEQETMLSSLMLARRLKKQLDLFVHYRELGIKTLEEAREYEVRRRRREQEIRLKKSKQGIDYLPSGAAELGNGPGGGNASTQSRSKGSAGGPSSSSNLNGLGVNDKDASMPTESEINAARRRLQCDAPDGSLLADDEIDICYKLNILPKHYLALQSVIVREAFRNGTITTDSVAELVNMDGPSQKLLCNFFVRALQEKFPNMPVDAGNGATLAGTKRGREEENGDGH